MAVMYAAMIIIDLRLIGVVMGDRPLSVMTRNLEPYMNWGLITMLVSGFLLFSSEAMKCFVNDGFRFKMLVLLPAVLFQFTLFRWATHRKEPECSRSLGWAVSVLSTVLWMGVGIGGRAIGFV